jgi:WD40 repeat protein
VLSTAVEGHSKRQFKNCHNYNINTLSVSPDGEHFISADDLTVNLWNIENHTTAYNLVDVKPETIADLSEVITYVEFHPRRPDTFVFSSSKGYMCLCDLRQATTFAKSSIRFQAKEEPSRRHFFTDIINAMTRAKFAPTSDNYIFSRDYLSV